MTSVSELLSLSAADHPQQWTIFRRAAHRKRLAHGYLFIGPKTARMQEFAHAFAQCLLCEKSNESGLSACGECRRCHQTAANSNPDFLTVGLPAGKNELPVELLIGKDDRRGKEGLCYELSLTPTIGTRRIAVLTDADCMNISSANALLKTLEEPTPGSILILIAHDSNRILPTIQSRCQTMYFPPAQNAIVQGFTDELVSNEQHTKLQSTIKKHFSKGNINRVTLFSDVSAWLDDIGGDTATQRKIAREVLKICSDFFRNQISESALVSNISELELATTMLDRTIEAEEHLDRQMPIPLCLESYFDAVTQLRRHVTA